MNPTQQQLFEALKNLPYMKERPKPPETSRDLIGDLSHELRKNLNPIISISSMATEDMLGPLTDEQKEYLGLIQAAGENLLAQLSDLITVLDNSLEGTTPG